MLEFPDVHKGKKSVDCRCYGVAGTMRDEVYQFIEENTNKDSKEQ